MYGAVAFVVSVALLSQSVSAYTDAALADKITHLPGAEKLDITFNQFSGYLAVPGNSGNSKNMHYWFVESMGNPTKDPIAFWTNGGPGCSGLIGFMTEQGPFKPNADLSLSLNEYAWNQISNMVYIESPAGVGFSYSDDKEDYTTGDDQTALDNYNLIQAFLARFPEYQTNDLYISSESYGGHYMPTLAKRIVDENTNAATTGKPVLNFKGFAVGNPYTDSYSGTPAMFDTFWGHQLLPKPTYEEYVTKCVNGVKPNVVECAKLMIEMNAAVGNLNPYALDYPVCTTDSPARRGRAQRTWLLNSMLSKFAPEDRQRMGVTLQGDYEPCADDYAESYLNQASVKAAIHVKEDLRWESCSYKIKYNTTDSTEVSTAPIYNYLIDGGYKLNILVYSGDDDSVCGTIGTQNWIWDLGYEVAGRPWQSYTFNQQVAGYATQWKDTKLGFLTVRGAGHEVPTYKPDVALDLWSRYLAGEFTQA